MTTLGHVCLVNPRSFVEPVGDDWPVSFVPMAAVEVRTGRIDLSQVRTYADVSKGYTRFSEGDVLFAKITPCMENGKIAIAKGLTNASGCGSTEFHVLRTEGGLSREYLMSFLLQDDFRKRAQRSMSGTAGQLRVPAAFLADAPFPLAPLPEQHRIVAEIEKQFTRLDASVESLKRAQANLKRCRASVLKSACEGSLVPTEAELARAEGRDYEPAGVLLERILAERRARWESQEKRRGKYKEPSAPDTSDLPDLPEGWAWATVQQLSNLIQYGTSAKASTDASGIPVLRMGNIQGGSLGYSDLKYLPEHNPDVQTTLLNHGDLLFNRTNSAELVGKSAVYKDNHPSACFASYLIRVSFSDEFSSDYACACINSQYGRSFIGRVKSQQVGQANVNGSKLASMPLPLPPLAEQQRIVAEVERRLSVIQQAEATVTASLARADRLARASSSRRFPANSSPEPRRRASLGPVGTHPGRA